MRSAASAASRVMRMEKAERASFLRMGLRHRPEPEPEPPPCRRLETELIKIVRIVRPPHAVRGPGVAEVEELAGDSSRQGERGHALGAEDVQARRQGRQDVELDSVQR